MNKFMKKIALALICCLTINSSSGAIAIAQTDLNEGDNLTPIIQEITSDQEGENQTENQNEEGVILPSEELPTEESNTQETLPESEEQISQEEQVADKEQLPQEPIEEENKEEVVPAIPEDIKNAILAKDRSTLYDATLDIDSNRSTTSTDSEDGANTLTLSKSAISKGNDKYEIQLDITGEAQQPELPTADIVIVMDRSGSMNGSKLTNTKNGIRKFCENILGTDPTKAPKNIGIALVAYSKSAEVLTATQDNNNLNLTTDQPFTNNYNTINSILYGDGTNKNPGITADEGTNTQAGVNRAYQVLEKSNAGKKYVVLFSDGIPTYYCSGPGYYKYNWFSKEWVSVSEQNATDEQKNRPAFGYDNVQANGYEDPMYNRELETCRNKAISSYDKLVKTYTEVKFYSVGLFTGDSATQSAKDLVYSMQNVSTDKDSYINNYFTNNENKIVDIFNSLGLEIQGDINKTIAKTVTVNDTITKYFSLPENAKYTITDFGSDTNNANRHIKVTNKTQSKNEAGEDVITFFEINEIKEPGISIKFTVDAKDPYFFGKDIPTNTVANISFKDPLDTNKEGEGVFPVPSVTIAPKIGEINVTKTVTKGGNSITNNDTFSVLINGQESSYNMDVPGDNNKQTMKFIMKGTNTDINDEYLKNYLLSLENTNKIKRYGFVTVGNYSVKEIVPMNYKQTLLTIDDDKDGTYDGKYNFPLDKDHDTISIKLVNNLENESYFFDKFTKPNRFKLSAS